MGLLKEFKDFAMKGNVLDLAVGVIIGGAFGSIVNSLVEDVITPLLLNPVLETAGVANIEQWQVNGVYWGKFIAAVISFLMIALVLFWLIKAANKITKPAVEETPAPSNEESLLMEIRDELRKRPL